MNIDRHDFDTKVNQGLKFLRSGDKLKISIRFRGREMSHTDLGMKILNDYAETMQEFGKIEKPGKLEGRNAILIMAPK